MAGPHLLHHAPPDRGKDLVDGVQVLAGVATRDTGKADHIAHGRGTACFTSEAGGPGRVGQAFAHPLPLLVGDAHAMVALRLGPVQPRSQPTGARGSIGHQLQLRAWSKHLVSICSIMDAVASGVCSGIFPGSGERHTPASVAPTTVAQVCSVRHANPRQPRVP